jgi:hypothetical protein
MDITVLQQPATQHLADLAYLVTRLTADPRAVRFAPGVEAASAGLQAQLEDWSRDRQVVQETQREATNARETLGNVEENLGNVARTAQAVILDDLRHNHRSPRFLTYFPRGLVAITRASYQSQLTSVRSLAQRCAQDPSPKVQEQAGLLNAAADQMDTAFARRGEALVAELASYGQLQVEKLATIDTCRRVGYRLAELYPNKPDRVRSYFRHTYRQARSTAPTAGDPTPQIQATATGTAANAAPAGSTLVLTPAAARNSPFGSHSPTTDSTRPRGSIRCPRKTRRNLMAPWMTTTVAVAFENGFFWKEFFDNRKQKAVP